MRYSFSGNFILKPSALKKNVFTLRVMKHQNSFSGELVDAPPLDVSKARLDGALSKVVQWDMPLPMAEVLQGDEL